MTYRYAPRRGDDTDLAGGRVLRSAPGMPGFPVRLASEISSGSDSFAAPAAAKPRTIR